VTGSGAAFLWGPRQIGKSTLLHHQFPDARFYDLLDTGLAAELSVAPRTLREQTPADQPEIVIIDEIQKVPDLSGMRTLLDEHKVGRTIVVSREPRPRTTEDQIEILPWQAFCKMLWGGELVP